MAQRRSFSTVSRTVSSPSAAIVGLRPSTPFHLSEPFFSELQLASGLPKSLQKHDSFLNSLSISLSNNGNPHTRGKKFEFFGAKTLFLRPSTISLFESLLDTQRDPLPIFLDGPRGAGKSATLLMTAQHFTSQNWLVLYEPMGSRYTNGSEPYGLLKKDENLYEQPFLARKLLERVFLSGHNQKILSTMDSKVGGKSMADWIKSGLGAKGSHSEFVQEALDAVLNHSKRPPVLLAIDQVNHFYAKTAYHDIYSEILMPNRLLLVKAFQEALKGIRRADAKLVCAQDFSNTHYPARALQALIESSDPTSSSTATSKLKSTLLQREGPSVSLPPHLDPSQKDPLDRSVLPGNKVSRVPIPPFTKAEISAWVSHYRSKNFLSNEMDSDTLTSSLLALTRGNGLDLLNQTMLR